MSVSKPPEMKSFSSIVFLCFLGNESMQRNTEYIWLQKFQKESVRILTYLLKLWQLLLLFPHVAAAAAAAAKLLQSCPTVWPHGRQPTKLPHPWDSPGKNTGVGCHFLLQCMKVKSEGEVAQSCLTLTDPMDCSLPGSSIHGIFQARVLEWGAIAFSTHTSKFIIVTK